MSPDVQFVAMAILVGLVVGAIIILAGYAVLGAGLLLVFVDGLQPRRLVGLLFMGVFIALALGGIWFLGSFLLGLLPK